MKKTSLLFLISLIFSFFCLFYLVPSKAKSNQETVELFNLIKTEKVIGADKAQSSVSIAAVREQEIGINLDSIDFETAQNLGFPLLDGKSYQAIRRGSEGFVRFADGGVTWRGKIFGDDDWSGDVILTAKGRALSGLIYSPGGVYEIVPQENFTHLLVEIDQSRFPSCGGAIPAKQESQNTEEQAKSLSDAQISFDDGSQIDVMVVYTASVRSVLGGTTQAQAFAQEAVSTTNTVYQNSGITTRLRLVYTMEGSYADNGTGRNGLDWVTADATVAAARNTVKADMVALLTENATDVCGIGWIMTSVNSSFASSAFSLTQRSCAIGGLTFPHELGHNQGCDHNPENSTLSSSELAYPYAYGHWNSSANFRTVMSYSNPCPSCARIPYFSNPSITHNGVPIGIANQRDNTRVINNTALTISQFRDSGGGTTIPRAQITSPANGATLTSSTATFTWGPVTSGVSYYFDVGNTQGSRDIYGNFASGGSTTVSGLPTDGRRIYVRLWTLIDGVWQYNDYSYLTRSTTPAQITSPVNGTTFASSTVTFTWSPVTSGVTYYLDLSSSVGSRDIFGNYVTGSSVILGGIPLDGRVIYARIWSLIGGVWFHNDYTYRAASIVKAAIATPANGATFASSIVTFTWSPVSNAVTYYLELNSSPGSRDIFANYVTVGSTIVTGIPTDGRTVYVRLWSLIGGVWQFNDYVYKASTTGSARISTPINGATFTSSTVTFTWNTVAGASQYFLDLNSSPGSRDIFANYVTGGSTTVSGIPADGRIIYVRLWTNIGGVWVYNAYTYTARRVP